MFQENDEISSQQHQQQRYQGQGQGQGQSSDLTIRPPHMAAVQSRGTVRHWRHNPNVLITSSCNYTVQVRTVKPPY